MFFRSAHDRYLLKSLGRTFENRFLHEHFLPKYIEFVRSHPDSLIHKIYDVLYSMERRFGEWMKLSPNHYIVIENLTYGKQDDWETFDLKPTSYLEVRRASLFRCPVYSVACLPALPRSPPRTLRRVRRDRRPAP